MHAAYDALRLAAATCLRALECAVGVAAGSWVQLTDLDDAGDAAVRRDGETLTGGYAGGPSVMRCYDYRPEASGCHAHADLGLLTISPAPRSHGHEHAAGLQVYDAERLAWDGTETDMGPDDLTIFAGEQLALLSAGAVPAALHRVPPPPAAASRLSMPFFARAHPGAQLCPAWGASGVCEHFVLEQLFRRRPWRPAPDDCSVPDY